MTESKKDSLIGKIKALQSKTVYNGCSESESLFAANKVEQLMNEYNITLTEVREEEFITTLKNLIFYDI